MPKKVQDELQTLIERLRSEQGHILVQGRALSREEQERAGRLGKAAELLEQAQALVASE